MSGLPNVVKYCYNKKNSSNIGGDMKPGRQGAVFPENVFNTWLDYREIGLKQKRADIIRELSSKLGRAYDNDRFYKWKKQKLSVPENVLVEVVYPELSDAITWLCKEKGWKLKDPELIALAIARPNDEEVLTALLRAQAKKLPVEELSAHLSPAKN